RGRGDGYKRKDIVAQDGESLVFVEVKYRKNGGMGDVLETVTPAKQRRIIRTARQYLYKNRLVDIPCRFDVIGFSGEALHYIENAFEVTD
ncbi:MAG: YraN family protein, partial [Clostridiaceae bacterium]|nr:YraN family protein [Clostridiaceae bacterium]